jgi:hypothetical protein
MMAAVLTLANAAVDPPLDEGTPSIGQKLCWQIASKR